MLKNKTLLIGLIIISLLALSGIVYAFTNDKNTETHDSSLEDDHCTDGHVDEACRLIK